MLSPPLLPRSTKLRANGTTRAATSPRDSCQRGVASVGWTSPHGQSWSRRRQNRSRVVFGRRSTTRTRRNRAGGGGGATRSRRSCRPGHETPAPLDCGQRARRVRRQTCAAQRRARRWPPRHAGWPGRSRQNARRASRRSRVPGRGPGSRPRSGCGPARGRSWCRQRAAEGLHVGVVERLVASTNQLLVRVCHGPSLPSMRWATLFAIPG
jgi:hypothetical protein